MEFSIDKQQLTKTLKRINDVCAKSSSAEVFKNTMIDVTVKDGSAYADFMATDMERAISCVQPVQSGVPGKICVSAKKLLDIILTIPKDNITFKTVDTSLQITSGKAKFKLPTVDAVNMPDIKQVALCFKPLSCFTIKAESLKELIDATVFASSDDELQGAFTSVLLDFTSEDEGNGIRFVACDTSRLSLLNRDFDSINLAEEHDDVLMSQQSLTDVKKLCLDEKDAIVEVLIGVTSIAFKLNNIHFSSRLREGSYVDYRQVIPNKSVFSITVDREEFIKVLKRMNAAGTATKDSPMIRVIFKTDSQTIDISTFSSDYNDTSLYGEESYDCTFTGTLPKNTMDGYTDNEYPAAMTTKYFIEALQHIVTDKAIISFVSNLMPIVIKNHDREDMVQILMPCRLNQNHGRDTDQ